MTGARSLPTLVAVLALSLSSANPSAAAREEDYWWAEARKASCQELIDAYRDTVAAEREVTAAIKASDGENIATNALGVATLATLGLGFFSWDDNASAEENLADLRNDLRIIKTVASEKKCELPDAASIK